MAIKNNTNNNNIIVNENSNSKDNTDTVSPVNDLEKNNLLPKQLN